MRFVGRSSTVVLSRSYGIRFRAISRLYERERARLPNENSHKNVNERPIYMLVHLLSIFPAEVRKGGGKI